MATTTLARAAKLFVAVLLLCLFPVDSFATSYHRKVHVRPHVKTLHPRQNTSSTILPVLGLPGLGVTEVYPRLEIRELQRRPDEFNVYMLGLRGFQNTSQDDKVSYFQIAGIHGRPFIPWDDVQGREDPKEGYCAHSSNLFPTWHRPYLALIEERIYYHAQQAIAEFPEGEFKNRMQIALLPLRLPYWDAAAVPPVGTGSFPWIVQKETVEIEVADGTGSKKITIPNPLYSYTFNPVPTKALFGKLPWTHWKTTKRYPLDRTADTTSQNEAIAWQLDSNLVNLRQRTYQMLAMQKEYHNISNNMVSSTLHGGVLDSLESVHDTIHNTVGNGGHLTNVAYSAFDPCFWLLHTNIDRMLAMWQLLNPDSYVTSHANSMATFTTPADSYADENTPLQPFHRNAEGDFWTSASVRDCTVFSYSYPELIGLSEDVTLVRRVNMLYGENATSQFTFKLGDPMPKSNGGYTPRRTVKFSDAVGRRAVAQRGPFQYQYFANIRAQKSGAEGAFKVFVFLGRTRQLQDSMTPMDWLHDPSFVGFTGFQSSSTLNYGGYSGNPADGDGKQQANGVVALTRALEDRVQAGALSGLDEKTVGEYLNREMSWRISTADHKYIHPNDAPGFKIEVSYAKIKPPTPDTFPEVQDGGFKHLMYATSGRAGGVQDGHMAT